MRTIHDCLVNLHLRRTIRFWQLEPTSCSQQSWKKKNTRKCQLRFVLGEATGSSVGRITYRYTNQPECPRRIPRGNRPEKNQKAAASGDRRRAAEVKGRKETGGGERVYGSGFPNSCRLWAFSNEDMGLNSGP